MSVHVCVCVQQKRAGEKKYAERNEDRLRWTKRERERERQIWRKEK